MNWTLGPQAKAQAKALPASAAQANAGPFREWSKRPKTKPDETADFLRRLQSRLEFSASFSLNSAATRGPTDRFSGICWTGAMAAHVFTGLVQRQGKLLSRTRRGSGFRLEIAEDFGPLDLGESIAVNGACLTVTRCHSKHFEADASAETVSRTTLGALPLGSSLHLERALRVGDRFGGHIVAGHVDATTQLLDSRQAGEAVELVFALPAQLLAFVADKGSIAIDGVSLTINRVTGSSFDVMVVPYTQQSTHLGLLRRGHVVNLEVDVVARYVVHQARAGTSMDESADSDLAAADRDASLRRTLTRAGLL